MKRLLIIVFLILVSGIGIYLFVRGNSNQVINGPITVSDEPKEEVISEKVASIMLFGDVMLDRRVYNLTKENGDWAYPFQNIEDIFDMADANIANLEGPITSFESDAAKTNGMRFTASPLFVSELKKRFLALSLANNHSLDFGEEGLRQTKRNLSEEGIIFFGDYENRGDNTSAVISVNGIKFGLVGYHALVEKNFDNVILDFKRLKEITDFIIVMPHWGEEYDELPSERQKADARLLIDAGADAIIGGHPHVIQPVDTYKGKAIFYSLGNFIFDQYFSEEVKKGIAVKLGLKITPDGQEVIYEMIPVQNNRLSQPVIMEKKETDALLEAFVMNSALTGAEREEISSFHRLTL